MNSGSSSPILAVAVFGLAVGAATACDQGLNNATPVQDPTRQRERDQLVEDHIIPRGVSDPAVLAAMRHVPRHEFVLEVDSVDAYADIPLPIGYDQTISQPSLVAFMTEALKITRGDKVLEIGTGSGYQAAILLALTPHVFTIELVEPLARRAAETLDRLGYRTVRTKVGDGYLGWPEEAPFDAIMVTAAPDHIPQPLLDQLAGGGRMIIPVGKFLQKLVLIRRTAEGYEETELHYVRFVPLRREEEPAAKASGRNR